MLMRRSIAVLAIAATAACAGRTIPTPEALAGPPNGDYPLEAWLSYQRVADLAFTVNQPAHVAIFYIAPGRGVSMVYPSFRDELGATDAGYNVPGYRYDPGQWYFVNSTFSRVAASPSYLLLVASREPLRVAEFERYPGLLRRTLGLNTFASYDAWDVMDELTQLVVPPQPDDAWSTDLVVLWPPMRANTYLASNDFYDTRLFRRCDNGRVIMVPWDYPYGGCPFFSTYGEGETSTPYTPNPKPETPDSTGGTPPSETPERPIEEEPESETPKRGTPRRVRESTESGAGPSVSIPGETRLPGRRTREAYPESSTRGDLRAWDRSARSFAEPRPVRGASRDFAPPAAGRRHSVGSSGTGSSDARQSPRAGRSEPRPERAAPAARERPSSPDRSPAGASSSSGSSSGGSSSGGSEPRPASGERPSSERPPR